MHIPQLVRQVHAHGRVHPHGREPHAHGQGCMHGVSACCEPYRVHPRHVLGVRPLDEGVVGFDRYNWLGGRAVSTWVREVQ